MLGLIAVLIASVSASVEVHDSLRMQVQEMGQKVPFAAEFANRVLDARDPAVWELGDITDGDPKWCPNNTAWRLIPETIARVPAPSKGGSTHFSTPQCWDEITATLRIGGAGDDFAFAVDLVGHKPDTLICGDTFIVTTNYGGRIAELVDLFPNVTVKFESWKTPGEQAEVMADGVGILLLPCGLVGTVESALATVELFIAEGEEGIQKNADFLTAYDIYSSPLQPFNTTAVVDKSHVRSGDYFAVAKFDGLDPLIMLGTLGKTGHSVVSVWKDDELYMLESTDADPFAPAYWPPPYGLRNTTYDEWMKLAQKANYHVWHLPIDETLADKFDEDNLWKWFESVQGEPYGYQDMLYVWWDTDNPQKSLPQPLDDVGTNWLVSTMDELLPYTPKSDVNAYTMLTWGLNKRLDTNCTTIACVLDHLRSRNMTLTQAMAIPSSDAWRVGKNETLVCSCFVSRVWQEGFGSNFPDIVSTEQSPKDNYQMGIYSKTRFDASICPPPALRTSPNGNYCQIMGPFAQELDHYNQYGPYKNMNNACASQWPDFKDRCVSGGDNCKC